MPQQGSNSNSGSSIFLSSPMMTLSSSSISLLLHSVATFYFPQNIPLSFSPAADSLYSSYSHCTSHLQYSETGAPCGEAVHCLINSVQRNAAASLHTFLLFEAPGGAGASTPAVSEPGSTSWAAVKLITPSAFCSASLCFLKGWRPSPPVRTAQSVTIFCPNLENHQEILQILALLSLPSSLCLINSGVQSIKIQSTSFLLLKPAITHFL